MGPGRIASAARRDDTTLQLGGLGDGFQMSWRADGRQLLAQEDGIGWDEDPKGFYNSRLWTITGDPHDAVFESVPGYPELIFGSRERPLPAYYGFGTLALDGHVYQFLSTLDDGRPRHWIGAKLIYSADDGATWHNQDGSSPVVWDEWDDRSAATMAFYREPGEAFSLLAFLQMGRNYEHNRDGYVYVYAPNGNIDGSMNELVMFRVAKDGILDRGAYEYFGGLLPDGTATWVADIEQRGVVHTFPRGWVNSSGQEGDLVVESWLPSVTYNAPLGVYIMANGGIGCAEDGGSFGKPSYLGFWAAPNPWGPWTQFHEETEWMPNGDPEARAFDIQIAPKWISEDGRSFWIVWCDLRNYQEFMRAAAANEWPRGAGPAEAGRVAAEIHRKYLTGYVFNTQRVDLTLG